MSAAPTRRSDRASRVETIGQACPTARDAQAAVHPVLARHGAQNSGLVVSVATEVVDDLTRRLQLRVLRADGDIGLDRSYELPRGDCSSAAQLVAVTVDRFLASFPRWLDSASGGDQPLRSTELEMRGGPTGFATPASYGGVVGLRASRGVTVHRLGVGLVVSGTLPIRVGAGRFFTAAALGELFWAGRWSRLELSLGLRGGVMTVSGTGFEQNETSALRWAEGAASLARRFGWGTLGLDLGASLWQHRALSHGDSNGSQDIPAFRLGLVASVPLWIQWD